MPAEGIGSSRLAERPELLRLVLRPRRRGLCRHGDLRPVTITLDEWLDGDGGDVPAGSFAALAGDDVVGFSGLCRDARRRLRGRPHGRPARLAPARARRVAQAGEARVGRRRPGSPRSSPGRSAGTRACGRSTSASAMPIAASASRYVTTPLDSSKLERMTEGEREITELRRDDRPDRRPTRPSGTPCSPALRSRLPSSSAAGSGVRTTLRLVARLDWAVAGCGAAIRSDLPSAGLHGRGRPPRARRRGLGRGLLERVVAAARGHGSEILAAGVEEGDVDGEAFAARFGFREVLREVEVVRQLRADEVEPPPLDDVEVAPLESAPGIAPTRRTTSSARRCRRCRSTRLSRCRRTTGGSKRTPPARTSSAAGR